MTNAAGPRSAEPRLLAVVRMNAMPAAPIRPSTDRSIEPIRTTRVAPTPTISGVAA